jgi:hypothetical protein
MAIYDLSCPKGFMPKSNSKKITPTDQISTLDVINGLFKLKHSGA